MNLSDSLILVKSAAESLAAVDSADDIIRLITGEGPHEQLFFSSLNDPAWIPVLVEADVFSKLPEITKGSVKEKRHARSLPLMGLARVASRDPVGCIQILESLPETENPQIHDQMMRCLAQIKDGQYAQRILKILETLLSGSDQNNWIWIEDILTSWVEQSKYDEAISLIRLYVNSILHSQGGRRANSAGWEFNEIDRRFIEPLARRRPLDFSKIFVEVLCDWKDQSIAEQRQHVPESEWREDAPDTYWLEDLKNRRSYSYELEEGIAARLYEIGAFIFDGGNEAKVNEYDELLRKDPWELFNRIRWQLYADHPAISLVWAQEDFVKRIPTLGYYSGSHGYEMAQMLDVFCEVHGRRFLSSKDVEKACEAILSGPLDENGKLEDDDQYIEVFRRKQLFPLRRILTGAFLEEYNQLARDKKDPAPDSYKPFSTGGGARTIEYVAPKPAERMAEMSDLELWDFLNHWRPDGNPRNSDEWWIEESLSAVAPLFADMVEHSEDRFSASTRWWENIRRPSILYVPLERASKRISAKSEHGSSDLPPTHNDWSNWFGLVEWIACWANNSVHSDDDRDESADWNWPRIIAVKFLASCIDPKFPVPEEFGARIGSLLRKFIEDPDPRLEANDRPLLKDWLTTAINSVRGTAFEYLLLLAFHQKQKGPARAPDKWIWQVVRSLLAEKSQSPALFAIIGSRLDLVFHLYANEIRENPELLLSKKDASHRHALILAHIRYCSPLGDVVKVFPNFADEALNCLSDYKSKGAFESEQLSANYGARLGTHLAFYYWNHLFPSDADAENTLSKYFTIAGAEQRAKAIGDIARIFSGSKCDEKHQHLYDRVMKIWEHRYSVIDCKLADGSYTPEDVHGELSAFISWLGCECFPFDWRRERALQAIKLLREAPQAVQALKSLTSISEDASKLEGCLEILEALVDKDAEVLYWAYEETEMKRLLRAGLQSKAGEVRYRAQRIQEMLLSRNMFEYLNLQDF